MALAGRPGPFFAAGAPPIAARACCSLSISASMRARRVVLMLISVVQQWTRWWATCAFPLVHIQPQLLRVLLTGCSSISLLGVNLAVEFRYRHAGLANVPVPGGEPNLYMRSRRMREFTLPVIYKIKFEIGIAHGFPRWKCTTQKGRGFAPRLP